MNKTVNIMDMLKEKFIGKVFMGSEYSDGKTEWYDIYNNELDEDYNPIGMPITDVGECVDADRDPAFYLTIGGEDILFYFSDTIYVR